MRGGAAIRAALALALWSSPRPAAAEDDCRTIRALAHIDANAFEDLTIGIARPFAIDIRAGRRSVPLETPEHCDMAAEAAGFDLTCYWSPGGFSAATAVYDGLYARLQRCLGGALTPSSGPHPYGDATSLRRSETELPTAGGATEIDLNLVESPGEGAPTRHYVTLSFTYQPASEEEAADEN